MAKLTQHQERIRNIVFQLTDEYEYAKCSECNKKKRFNYKNYSWIMATHDDYDAVKKSPQHYSAYICYDCRKKNHPNIKEPYHMKVSNKILLPNESK